MHGDGLSTSDGILASDGERNVFSVTRAFKDLGDKLPALIPQVYLHYDPYTLAQFRRGWTLVSATHGLPTLFSDAGRVVVEVDGSQHFAEDGKPSLARYADMVAADRDLRLAGYEVYRFGPTKPPATGRRNGSKHSSGAYFGSTRSFPEPVRLSDHANRSELVDGFNSANGESHWRPV